MKNLNYLTDLQVSYDNLESLTEENSIVDELAIVNDAVDTLQTLRLTGINWTLADTTLLNQILAMNSSVLTGKVYISGAIRNQELLNYAKAWADLEVTYNVANLVTQYLVTYVNDDDQNTVLYEAYVDRGSTPPDPYAEGWIAKPEKAADAQYTYEFDSWDGIEDDVLTAKTVTAKYTETVRTYTVTWYSRPGLPLTSVTADYGSEVVYPGETPTNETEEATYIYNVFAGWDKSTGYITEDTDVYAIWARAELPTTEKDLKDMTPGEIFAVTSSGRTANYFTLKDYVDITLGHDFDFSNVESEVLAENLYLDGQTAVDKQVTLFGENDRSFTMAIDYQFTGTDTNSTLVSCFEEDGSEGFRLRYNGQPDIQWGDVSQKFGSGKYRDIVVIRHRKGEDKLYVYASNNTSSSFDMSTLRAELTRTRSTTTDQIITFGAIRFKADGGHDDYGHGHIHWCKIWYEDLGDTNAQQLASWYREPVRMEYYGTNIYRLAGGTSQKSNASFICNHLLAARGQVMNPAPNTNAGGWEASRMRTFLNTRFLAALPTVWQSMLKQVKISASAGSQSTEILISEDYIYLPCLTEMNNASDSIYPSEGDYITWYTSNPARVKFRGYKIPDDSTRYTASSDPSTSSTNNVKEGDVWIHSGNSSIGYTYVTQQYLDEYGITPKYTASIGGGWIEATYWWLRSPYVGYSTYFWFVYYNGTCSNGGASYSSGVCPCFSI